MPPWTGCRVVAPFAGAVVVVGLMRGLTPARDPSSRSGRGLTTLRQQNALFLELICLPLDCRQRSAKSEACISLEPAIPFVTLGRSQAVLELLGLPARIQLV